MRLQTDLSDFSLRREPRERLGFRPRDGPPSVHSPGRVTSNGRPWLGLLFKLPQVFPSHDVSRETRTIHEAETLAGGTFLISSCQKLPLKLRSLRKADQESSPVPARWARRKGHQRYAASAAPSAGTPATGPPGLYLRFPGRRQESSNGALGQPKTVLWQ